MNNIIISVLLASGIDKTIMLCRNNPISDMDIINHVLCKYDIKHINYIINY